MHGFAARGLLIGFAVVVVAGLSATQALATHVSCGDTITQDTTLDSDLVNCPGDGLVIGADNVELDLNGHTIDGPGADPFIGNFDGVGNREGHDGVTIRNGTIREFDNGVMLGAGFDTGTGPFIADRNILRRLTISDVEDGVIGAEARSSLFERNVIRSSQSAIALAGAVVERGSNDNVIAGNDTDSVRPFPFTSGGGIGVDGDDNVVEKNAVDNGSLQVFGDRNVIDKNSPSNSLDAGVALFGNDNQLTKNLASGNTLGFLMGGSANRVEQNSALTNFGDGFSVIGGAGSTGNVLLGNLAAGNTGDGIDVDTPGVQLTRNTANDNRELGIEAVPGTIDGGGNKASGNGNPLQCLNVFCK
jgi:Periplasmic copper-binding protein (NosD)